MATATERRTSLLRDVFAWNENEEACLRYESMAEATADLRADYSHKEIVAMWIIEEWADYIGSDGDPVVESRKWTPALERDLITGELLLTWTTKGWK